MFWNTHILDWGVVVIILYITYSTTAWQFIRRNMVFGDLQIWT